MPGNVRERGPKMTVQWSAVRRASDAPSATVPFAAHQRPNGVRKGNGEVNRHDTGATLRSTFDESTECLSASAP
jgi:hypothetical protein